MERNEFVFYNPFTPPSPLPGSIPQLYRDVYDAISLTNTSKLPKELWLKVIATGHIKEQTAQEVNLLSCVYSAVVIVLP
jgi:hypothetical protein